MCNYHTKNPDKSYVLFLQITYTHTKWYMISETLSFSHSSISPKELYILWLKVPSPFFFFFFFPLWLYLLHRDICVRKNKPAQEQGYAHTVTHTGIY